MKGQNPNLIKCCELTDKTAEKEKKYQEAQRREVINCLYSYFKNAPKKLKVVCDWDEVIQPLEPYALWKVIRKDDDYVFADFFKDFWKDDSEPIIEYSPYGSSLMNDNYFYEEQQKQKNSSGFYQKSPFLTIAKELLKLVKENKVEVFFLSAYDKKTFANGDPRKKKIFGETFGKFPNCSLSLLGFDSEGQGQTKGEWIKKNVPDCNVVIDDNPNILNNIAKNNDKIIVVAPFYPAIKHHERILLVKTSLSDLKKEDFKII
jgi:hypothetical protein